MLPDGICTIHRFIPFELMLFRSEILYACIDVHYGTKSTRVNKILNIDLVFCYIQFRS